MRQIPGTNKVGAIGFCWGGRYAILQAHGKKEGSVGGVDAAYACHPSLVAIPGDFYPATRSSSLALGDQDSLLDQKSVGQIQDVMNKKTDVPHEIWVCNKSARVVGALLTSNLPCRYMKVKSMGSPFEATGAAVKTAHSASNRPIGMGSTKFQRWYRLLWGEVGWLQERGGLVHRPPYCGSTSGTLPAVVVLDVRLLVVGVF
jgi:hypothetical protein